VTRVTVKKARFNIQDYFVTGGLGIQIEDNGIGFDPSQSKAGSHGIAGMRFRMEQLKGTFAVSSRLGSGTMLDATLPSALAALELGAAATWVRVRSLRRRHPPGRFQTLTVPAPGDLISVSDHSAE
jgi:signal transduction histidine kinase